MKILIAGDFVPSNRVVRMLNNKEYDTILGEVKPLLSEVDYSIVNLEAPVIHGQPTPIDKAGPNLYCTENTIEAIRWARFNCVTLANNHFRDQGEQGVYDTLASCEKYGIGYVGGGKNLEEASRILYKQINDKTLAIVNFCENEWSIATEKYGGSSPLNPIINFYQIQEARKNADHVLVIVHGGIELYQYPTPRMQETYRFFIDAGADAVVNHHQHCYSGYEQYKGKPIFYGLGNFCFDRNNPSDTMWSQGYMVKLKFERSGITYEIYPFFQCTNNPIIALMSDKDRDCFFKSISQINSTILDEHKLRSQFDILVKKSQTSKLLEFEPISNRFIRVLQIKKLLPSFISNKTRRDIYDIINCESHREIVLRIFNELFSNENK